HVGNLEPRRDLTFVEDTVRAFVLAGTAPDIDGQVIHFGQGEAISIGDLARRCLQTASSRARVVSTSERVRPEKSEVDLLLCDPTRALEKLRWSHKVPLDEGLRRTADYIRAHPEQYPSRGYVV